MRVGDGIVVEQGNIGRAKVTQSDVVAFREAEIVAIQDEARLGGQGRSEPIGLESEDRSASRRNEPSNRAITTSTSLKSR